MTCFPVFGTYYICLSHHVLTWNYSSCVSCISHLWWDTFKLAVWYWFASWIWFLACIASNLWRPPMTRQFYLGRVILIAPFIWCLVCSASNLLKCLLLSYHIIGVNMSSRPFFRTYSILVSWLCVATRPQTVQSLCSGVIPGSVMLTPHSTWRIYNRVAITHLLHRVSQKRTYYNKYGLRPSNNDNSGRLGR